MMHLSRHTVRQGWPPYVGSAVAVSLGVALIFLTVTMLHAVDNGISAAGVSPEVKTQLDELATLFGIMSAVSMFMALFVVGSTFGFVVAARRRELGLLRLVGATPRQVRRLVLGESLVVALASALIGSVLAALAAPGLLWLLHERGLTPIRLEAPSPWLAVTIAVPAGLLVALAGAWRSSRRAARITPMAALLESSVERRRVSVAQLLVGTLCLGGTVAVVAVVSADLDPLFALVASVLLPELAVVGLVCFGGVLFPALAGLLATPFVRRDVAARLARDQVRAAGRTTASTAAPVLAISAIAGSMILSLSFVADWTTGLNREQLNAPLVVETAGNAAVVDTLTAAPEVGHVDARLVTTAGLGRAREPVEVEGVDPVAAAAARGLTAVEGDLSALAHNGVAISESVTLDYGIRHGDLVRLTFDDGTPLELRVRTVVADAPDLHAEILVPRQVVEAHAKRLLPDLAFVTLRDGTDVGTAGERLTTSLAGTGGAVLLADDWIATTDDQTRKANQLGLWVLLGPSGLYAGIAVSNTILIGSLQRRRELEAMSLNGATREQLRRMALWEAGLVGAAALLVGGATAAGLGWMVRHAITQDVGSSPMTIPWAALGGIVLTGLVLVLAAGFAGSAAATRRRAA